MENQLEFSLEGVLSGPYCDDAIKLIDVQYLLHHPINQQDYQNRANQLNQWVRRTQLLDIEGTDPEDTLSKLQVYIEATAADKRCPCELGVELDSSTDHFPDCEDAWTLRDRERQLADIVSEEMALGKKKHDLLMCWQRKHDDAMELKGCWSKTTLHHLGTAFLKSIKGAIGDELVQRYISPIQPYIFSVIFVNLICVSTCIAVWTGYRSSYLLYL